MALIIAVHNSGLTRAKYFAYKGTFVSLSISEKYFWRNRMVHVETKMKLCFFCLLSVICPMHGKDRINEWTINTDEFPKMLMFLGEYFRGISLKFRENIEELLQAPVVYGLKKTALFNTIRRGYLGSGKITFFEFLQEGSPWWMLFEVIINERFELLFKIHLQRSVSFCFQRWYRIKNVVYRDK